MTTYRFNWRYSSSLGTWEAGSEQPFDDALAAHILRDSPGCMDEVKAEPEKVEEDEPKTRAVDKPANDRQVKSPANKRSV